MPRITAIEQWLHTDKVRKLVCTSPVTYWAYVPCWIISNTVKAALHKSSLRALFFKHFPVHKYLAVCGPNAHSNMCRCSCEVSAELFTVNQKLIYVDRFHWHSPALTLIKILPPLHTVVTRDKRNRHSKNHSSFLKFFLCKCAKNTG